MEVISALDSHNTEQVGENGHTELAWSNDIQEQIIQLDFQCVRTSKEQIQELSGKLHNLLRILSEPTKRDENMQHLLTLYKLIGKTRDVHGGKGEYALAYMMIWAWYAYYPELAKEAITLFVTSPDPEIPPYGSWKDVKYMCDYAHGLGAFKNHGLIQHCIQLINTQLRKDNEAYQEWCKEPSEPRLTISLCAKWIPRESSGKFGWLTEEFAHN